MKLNTSRSYVGLWRTTTSGMGTHGTITVLPSVSITMSEVLRANVGGTERWENSSFIRSLNFVLLSPTYFLKKRALQFSGLLQVI